MPGVVPRVPARGPRVVAHPARTDAGRCAVRFLLPPSETKRDGTSAAPLELEALSAATLTRDRARIVAALAKYCAKPTPRVRTAIGTTINQDAELARNARLVDAPTAPAHAIYDGVLFDAIDLAVVTPDVRTRIIDSVLVQSALFGIVGFGDAIPAYRCSADSSLPRFGRLGTFWRPRLDRVMPQLLGDDLVLDLRSGTYASMWTPRADMRERTAVVKIMQLRDGKRLAVSHFNKATKGRLVRGLCGLNAPLSSIDDAVAAIARIGFEAELVRIKDVNVIEVLTDLGCASLT